MKIRLMLVVIVFACLVGLPVGAQEVLFETDFDGDSGALDIVNEDGDPYPHTFIEEGGRSIARIETKEESVFFMFPTSADWNEYSIEFQTRMNWGYLTLFTSQDCEGHSVRMDMLAHLARIVSITDNCSEGTNSATMPSIEMNRGEWITLRIEVRQDRLNLFVNGELLTDLVDEAVVGQAPYLYFEHIDPEFFRQTAYIEFDSLVATSFSTSQPGEGRTSRDEEEDDEEAVVELSTTDFDPTGTQQEIIDSLRALGYLPEDGGSYLFGEDYAYFFGQGNWFTPLASRSPRTDVVIAGDLTFSFGESENEQTCSLMAHVSVDGAGSTTQQLEGGVNGDGYAYILDAEDFERSSFDYYEEFVGIDSGDTIHVLMLVIAGDTTLFIDGEAVIDDVKTDNRSGTFGIALDGMTPDDGCEGRNIWAWSFDE